ncbi:hypothetical protein HDU87_004440 [Geranomyces variabilis]|uniref:Uncharacterized protein n=1 Tax=Geranomyces variabilis TaxID=109894 RepID=A0AAD5TKV2_9FUNG|nr:hypothetical protein HDU87_004440 [Geranomyces variabilis]
MKRRATVIESDDGSDNEGHVASPSSPSSAPMSPVRKRQSTMDNFFAKSPTKVAKVTKPSQSKAPTPAGPSGASSSVGSSPSNKDLAHALASLQGDAKRREATKMDAFATLPPLRELPEMFDHMIGNLDFLVGLPVTSTLVKRLNGRKLRLATMCSGTESPVLALREITRAIARSQGVTFEVEHVFSCEIDAFKQAYIERNFAPPLLFRDICDLGNDFAPTAYGALRVVPGNVDVLVSGTSCVDFSNLNNQKKSLTDKGESGKTFRGMMRYVAKHRPSIIIMENVCSAEWKTEIVPAIEKENYHVLTVHLDTKLYYIPHTRTRGYLFAVAKEFPTANTKMPATWRELVQSLVRPASMPLEAFLLAEDDPRVQKARQNWTKPEGLRRGRTEWTRCESRHKKARDEEELGTLRPLTEWQDGGISTLMQSSWQTWANMQTERVLDLMDIVYMRLAKDHVDASFKTLVWNLSQNVDRVSGTAGYGICPCLTPTGIPYITSRRGPLIGLEALSLQALPIDDLLLTREDDNELGDLAGNAMSSTVVGTCILAALTVALGGFKPGEGSTQEETKAEEHEVLKITGEDQLTVRPYALNACRPLGTIAGILDQARDSARLCKCEGRDVLSPAKMRVCRDCQATSCEKCGKRPKHNYEPVTFQRIKPDVFETALKGVLPMRLSIDGFTAELLDGAMGALAADEPSFEKWREVTIAALQNAEFRFRILKRQEHWVAVYGAPSASLELVIDPVEPEWRLTIHPPPTEPIHSRLSELLALPIARMTLTRDSKDFMSGDWWLYAPASKTFDVTITGSGELVPSWKARLGLQGGLENEKWWSKLIVSDIPEDARDWMERDVTGSYTLYEKCGTAKCALHKREAKSGEETLNPMLLFLDPKLGTGPINDCFVFATSARELIYGETRFIAAKLSPTWGPSDRVGPQRVSCTVPARRIRSQGIRMCVPAANEASFSLPESVLTVDPKACDQAAMLLHCSVPLTFEDALWPSGGDWADVDLSHKGRTTFKSLTWITERLPRFGHLEQWMDMGEAPLTFSCQRCAPTPPDVKWVVNSNRLMPVEDPEQAGPYEQSLKNRPQPFVAQLRSRNGTGELRIGVNIATLLHRALCSLQSTDRTNLALLSWRLKVGGYALGEFPAFSLPSNRADPEHAQPPHFKKFPLRPEQLRSLTWMVNQERSDAPPFVEEEISEAVFEPMNWRVEAKAERPVPIAGGVLADDVGYGKTAITLGLIDCGEAPNPLPVIEGAISVKGTLIVVPGHLIKQWPSEIEKFTGKTFKTIIIESLAHLNRQSIADFQAADIILVSSSVFRSPEYLRRLALFAGNGKLPSGVGRHFTLKHQIALKALREQVDRLQTGGEEGLQTVIDMIDVGRTYVDPTHIKMSSRKGKQGGEDGDEEVLSEAEEEAKENSDEEGDEAEESEEELKPTAGKRKKQSSPVAERPKRQRVTRQIVLDTDEEDTPGVGDGSDDDFMDADPEYEVEGILNIDETGDEPHYQVKWKGYDDNAATWEPLHNLGHLEDLQELIDEWKATKDGGSQKVLKDKNTTPKVPTKAAETATKKATKKAATKKSAAKKPVAKKPAKKEDTDPWGLRSSVVRKNWRAMKSPLFEMFNFNRLVVDEYTYIDGHIYAGVINTRASKRWILSGTPDYQNFQSVKNIAAYLGVHLGVDDQALRSKGRNKKHHTNGEELLSFLGVHTNAWHAHRHQLAQTFLSRFVRQNVAEIAEIPAEEHEIKITLPAAERAIYLELEHHLQAMEMDTRKTLKTKSDKDRRVREAMGSSKTAEEALLKRCSHFDLHLADETTTKKKSAAAAAAVRLAPVEKDARHACEVIADERTIQVEETKEQLVEELKAAEALNRTLMRTGKFRKDVPSPWPEWKERWLKGQDIGDPKAQEIIHGLLQGSGFSGTAEGGKAVSAFAEMMGASAKGGKAAKGKANAKGEGKKAPAKPKKKVVVSDSESDGDDADDDENAEDDVDAMPVKKVTLDNDVWALREMIHGLRRCMKELVGRVRSLRYFDLVRALQKANREGAQPTPRYCVTCSDPTVPIPADKVAVFSCCGHIGCEPCLIEAAYKQQCTVPGCEAPVRITSITKASVIGAEDDADELNRFGKKLTALVQLVKSLPAEDNVLVFVQFDDLMARVTEALSHSNISFKQLQGSATATSKALTEFQRDEGNRVLLLNVMTESASGANLTIANHVIFLSPLLAPTQQEYTAAEVQAIGRVRRYGQKKTVHIHRFLSLDTMDTQIYETRARTVLK